jgi:hypothetical protein
MEAEDSQEPATGPYPESNESSSRHPTLQANISLSSHIIRFSAPLSTESFAFLVRHVKLSADGSMCI